MNRKDVLGLLTSPRPKSATGSHPAPDPEEEKTQPRSLTRRNTNPSVPLADTRNIEVLVNDSHTEANEAVKNVQADILLQNKQLNQRLKERKRVKSLSRPTSPALDSPRINSDDSYETELEAILERYLLEKQTEVAAMKHQFQEQIAEIEVLATKSSNSLLQKVITQMKRAQESALTRLETDLFNRKQAEINALRQKWLR